MEIVDPVRQLGITYPAQLPITARRVELVSAIREHQVLVVAGETGSGKSTQLPKLCLEAGRGQDGLIGHTQPRRIAARTIAERIAEELGSELGSTVGYAVRFTDRVGAETRVKVMTDGILLAEIQRDRMLRRYDTIIVDEAHERSLNIDFLLGYLRQLLPKRPDLKVIITSATIDTSRFSEHFGDAPVIEVSGRTYPVEVRYRPYGTGEMDDDNETLADDVGGVDHEEVGPGTHRAQTRRTSRDDRDQTQAICDAVAELAVEAPGDVLVFLSGEREIRDTAQALGDQQLAHTEVLPLYARLSAAEQHRIFRPHTGRRIVLATNVAETSLTVPGVRYVVDAGTARISRYSTRLKVQRLPIERVSQASANQRAGRCGRVAPGVCIRLYDEADFVARPEFTEPEVLRTSLASVILQMVALGLGDVAAFPFLDPPDSRAIRDGVLLLEELGALPPDQPSDRRRLTTLGKRLARLPIDPRLARMVLEAERLGCVREVMVIAAVLSIQDPRERPTDARQAADEAHRRFATDSSDFMAFVRLWDHLGERQRALSSNQFRKLCRSEFLHYLRVREWRDLFGQLRQAAAAVGIRSGSAGGPDTGSHPDRVHQAMLAGLLSHIGMRDQVKRDYRGARGARFMVGRESSAAKAQPRWVMAAELVETNRLWARTVAPIQPEWAEQLAGPLATRSYGEPMWDARRGAAVAIERVSLYGLPIVSGRKVGYDRVDVEVAREMFLRHALVHGEVQGGWADHHGFVAANRAVIAEAKAAAQRSRRGDLVDDATVFAFYDRRVGADVVSTRHFDRWWKTAGARRAPEGRPELLTMTVDDLLGDEDGAHDPHDFPAVWRQGDLELDVTYRFEPGEPGDGVNVHIPLAVLNRVRDDGFDWQVSGNREQLIGAYVHSLPKQLRRALSPLGETIRAAQRRLDPGSGRLTDGLAAALTEMAGTAVRPSDFDPDAVPGHLQVTFVVEDDHRTPLATGTDLGALRRLLAAPVRQAVAQATPGVERSGITGWDFGELPRSVESERDGNRVIAYPALLDDGDSVAIRVFTTEALQTKAMRTGVRRLMLLAAPVNVGRLVRSLSNQDRLALATTSFAPDELAGDCVTAVADALVGEGAAVWDGVAFDELVVAARARLAPEAGAALRAAARVVSRAERVRSELDRLVVPALRSSVDDMRAQLARLVRPGFVAASGVRRLADLERYVTAIGRRAERLTEDPGRDRRRMAEVIELEQRYVAALDRLPRGSAMSEVIDLGWQLEELRVSVFAQSLGTAVPVSPQRIVKRLDALAR